MHDVKSGSHSELRLYESRNVCSLNSKTLSLQENSEEKKIL